MVTKRHGFRSPSEFFRQVVATDLSGWLLRVVDFAIAGVLFVAPLFLGGRHPVGALVYVVLVGVATVGWFARQALQANATWQWSGVELLLLAGLLLIVLQILPLPPSIVHRLSPAISDLLPAWSADSSSSVHLGDWPQVSLTPPATRVGLVTFAAHAMLFFVIVQRIRDLADIERLFRWIAVATLALAGLGLLQFLLSNGKFLWIYEHPYRDTSRNVKGPFINENHFAHCLALGIAPLIWWLRRVFDHSGATAPTARHGSQPTSTPRGSSVRRGSQTPPPRATAHLPLSLSEVVRAFRRRAANFGNGGRERDSVQLAKLALGISLGVVAFAGLLTFSRGGVVVIFLAAATCVALFTWKSLLGKRSLLALAGVGLVVGMALLIFGYQPLADQMGTIGTADIDELDSGAARRKLWQADLQAAALFPLLGTGGGSHAEVYPVYYEDYRTVEYSHAESGYIQVLLEAGTIGMLLLVIAIGVGVFWCVSALRHSISPKTTACAVVAVAALVASLVHSIWDFVWYIPTCLSWTLILMACVCRLRQITIGASRLAVPRRKLASNAGRNTTEVSAIASHQKWLAGTFARCWEVVAQAAETLRNLVVWRPANIWPRRASRAPLPNLLPRIQWTSAAVLCLGVVVMMIKTDLGPALAARHWERYLVADLAAKTRDNVKHEPNLEAMVQHLERALEIDPANARANLAMASCCLQRFNQAQQQSENAMDLAQIRDAALASRFPSNAALTQWLSAVLGDNHRDLNQARHYTCRAMRLCPLQGEAYVFLADLAFLDGATPASSEALLRQALCVRPYRGGVLFAAGSHAAQRGDFEQALSYWKDAFHQDPRYQAQIIAALAPRLPASFILKNFEPDTSGAQRLFVTYQQLGRDDQARAIGESYVVMLEEDAVSQTADVAVHCWQQAYQVYRFLGDQPGAMRCLKSALNCAPDNYDLHRNLALELLAGHEFDDAIDQIQWCRSRRPGDTLLDNLLLKARKLSIAQPQTSALPDNSRKKPKLR